MLCDTMLYSFPWYKYKSLKHQLQKQKQLIADLENKLMSQVQMHINKKYILKYLISDIPLRTNLCI